MIDNKIWRFIILIKCYLVCFCFILLMIFFSFLLVWFFFSSLVFRVLFLWIRMILLGILFIVLLLVFFDNCIFSCVCNVLLVWILFFKCRCNFCILVMKLVNSLFMVDCFWFVIGVWEDWFCIFEYMLFLFFRVLFSFLLFFSLFFNSWFLLSSILFIWWSFFVFLEEDLFCGGDVCGFLNE